MSMTRKQIIDFLKSKNVEFNATLRLPDLEKLYALHSGKKEDEVIPPGPKVPEESASDMDRVLNAIGKVAEQVGNIDSRLKKIEGPTGNEYRRDAKMEDIDTASKTKEAIDARIVKIVEETLGVDFGIDMDTFPDRPGFLFTVIVPTRLSDMPPSTRPGKDPETGKYKVLEDGKTPVLEDYIPEDRRSRAIGSAQSYDAIREHCNRVRSYIVSYYAKVSKPLPEFKIKG